MTLLRHLLQHLSQHERRVVEVLFLGELTPAQAARALGMTRQAVEEMAGEALQKLQAIAAKPQGAKGE